MLSRPCGSDVDTGGAVGPGQQGSDQWSENGVLTFHQWTGGIDSDESGVKYYHCPPPLSSANLNQDAKKKEDLR